MKREWLTLLINEVFNPDMGLFKLTHNKVSYQLNPLSYIIPEHLFHFRMIGRLIGKALISDWNLSVCFVTSFLKLILSNLFMSDKEVPEPDAILFSWKN